MESAQQTRAIRYAKVHAFKRRVDYAQIERFQASRFPALKARIARRTWWSIVMIVCSAAVVGAVAATGPGGYVPGIRGSFAVDAMDDDTRAVVMPLSFLLGSVGMIMWIVTWARTQRMRDVRAIVLALLAVAVCVATGFSMRDDGPEGLWPTLVLLIVNGVLAVVVLLLTVLAGRRGDPDFAAEAQVGEWLRELPDDARRGHLDEREQIVEILLDRGEIDRKEASMVHALPVGDLWKAGRRYRRCVERRARKRERG